MPTRRAWTLFLLSFLFYLLANQTQSGWLYILSNLLLGTLLALWLLGWRALRAVAASRQLHPPDTSPAPDAGQRLHEGDPLAVTVRLHNESRRPLFALRADEQCSIAPPDDAAQRLWLPQLGSGQAATFRYQFLCARRGPFSFPPLQLQTAGPFGLFRTRRALPAPAEGLVFPFYHPFRRLPALHALTLPERASRRAGTGSEIIGTRDYRPGDPPRTVHWRSSARSGRLIVKEFAEEAQPTLTVALDLFHPPSPAHGAAFETMIRIAASLGHYATRRAIPFQLLGSHPRWRPPRGPLSWWALLTLLAKVTPEGEKPFAQLLAGVSGGQHLVALFSHPTPAIARALGDLTRRGVPIWAIVVTPDSTPPAPATLPAPTRGLRLSVVPADGWIEMLERTPGTRE